MHPEIAILIARQQCAERIATFGRRRGTGRTHPVKGLRRVVRRGRV
jgi:hypothetical protein